MLQRRSTTDSYFLLIIPLQINICQNLNGAVHYSLGREEEVDFFKALHSVWRKSLVEVVIVESDNLVLGVDSFVNVKNTRDSDEFTKIGMVNLSHRIDEGQCVVKRAAKKKEHQAKKTPKLKQPELKNGNTVLANRKASADSNRGNLCRSFGLCAINNSTRTKESLGLPFPRTFDDTGEIWVQQLFMNATSMMRDFSTTLGIDMYCGDEERARKFASTLVPNVEGSNDIEAITIHRYSQQAMFDSDGKFICHSRPWCHRVWDCLLGGNSQGLAQLEVTPVVNGPHLLGCHVDSNNDNDNPSYSKVLNMSEYLWCPDEMCIVRRIWRSTRGGTWPES
jgi:hypothetical protein